MSKSSYALTGGRIVLPRDVIAGGSVLVDKGIITAVLERREAPPPRYRRIEARDAWVTPGLVEHHIHGCGGVGFDSLGPDPAAGAAALHRARDFLRSKGVTRFTPTLVCREAEIAALAAALDEANLPETCVPGMYVEGPFIEGGRRGGIPANAVRRPDADYLGRLIDLARGRLRLMTLAPELAGADKIVARLEGSRVLPCLGHSNARLDRSELMALPSGPFSITHLFNAMSGFSHKEPGLAMLPFLDPRPFVELNADGIHVCESALRVCARSIEPDKLILTSDAVVAAGLPYGEYTYYGMTVSSGPGGVRYLPEPGSPEGLLMGSNRIAPDILRNWLASTGASAENAVRMLTLTPSRALGLDSRRGAIAPGLEAELVIWEGEFESVREILD